MVSATPEHGKANEREQDEQAGDQHEAVHSATVGGLTVALMSRPLGSSEESPSSAVP
jgi:hypothetical protein